MSFFIAPLKIFCDLVFGKAASYCRSLSQATFDDAGICSLHEKWFFNQPLRCFSPTSVFPFWMFAHLLWTQLHLWSHSFLHLQPFFSTIYSEKFVFHVFFQFPYNSSNCANFFLSLWFGFGFLVFLWDFKGYIYSQSVKLAGGIEIYVTAKVKLMTFCMVQFCTLFS